MITKLMKFSHSKVPYDMNINKKKHLSTIKQSTKKVTFLSKSTPKDLQHVQILIIETRRNLMEQQHIKLNTVLKK